MKSRLLTLILIPCLCALVFTACSDDDDDGDTSPATATGSGGTSGGGSAGGEALGDGDPPAADSNQSQVPLQAPTLDSPPNGWNYPSGKGGEQVQLIWNPAQGAQSYIARIWRTDRTSDVQNFDVGSKTMHTVATRIGEYQWQVASVRGSEKKWSQSRKFTIVN